VLVPEPDVIVPPGDMVIVHSLLDGKSFRTTLPVETRHVGWVLGPIRGSLGGVSTVSVNVSVATVQSGLKLSVVRVMVTSDPMSLVPGV
jgi:hypothetical protein